MACFGLWHEKRVTLAVPLFYGISNVFVLEYIFNFFQCSYRKGIDTLPFQPTYTVRTLEEIKNIL